MRLDDGMLEAALIGLRYQLGRIDEEMAALRVKLSKTRRVSSNATHSSRGRMSAEGRKRIALAQKRRWREWRKQRA